jgi:NAD(P)H-hydrate repair Nnr-like enzyme with NAD(P)H-hydrate epimerase domain
LSMRLLGTGLTGDVASPMPAIAAINASGLPVVAVDIPSGLCADTGCSLRGARDLTVTFIGWKRACSPVTRRMWSASWCSTTAADPDSTVTFRSRLRLNAAICRAWLRVPCA